MISGDRGDNSARRLGRRSIASTERYPTRTPIDVRELTGRTPRSTRAFIERESGDLSRRVAVHADVPMTALPCIYVIYRKYFAPAALSRSPKTAIFTRSRSTRSMTTQRPVLGITEIGGSPAEAPREFSPSVIELRRGSSQFLFTVLRSLSYANYAD
jgi:hypothetical protein